MALFTPKAFVEAFFGESPLGIHIQMAQVAEALKQRGYTGQVGIYRNPAAHAHYRIVIKWKKWKYTPRSCGRDDIRRKIVQDVVQVVQEVVTPHVYVTKDFAMQDFLLCSGIILLGALCVEFLPTPMGGRLPRPFKPINRVF